MELKDRVAIVTGGSGGLGDHISRALASTGARIAVVYNSREEEAAENASRLRESGTEAEPFHCDVTDEGQVDALVSQVLARFGRVDILVNNAGYNKWIEYTDLDALTYEFWSKVLSINLTGPMLCIKAVAGPMKRQGAGRIVNISSAAGVGPTGSSIAYAVSKAGLNHLTKCMAVSLAPDVLVNCVAPGLLEGTRMSANLSVEHQKFAVQQSLLKRPADMDDIANQVVAFCRTETTTGQTLLMDSGRYFH